MENSRKGIVISIASIELENIKLEMLYPLCSSTCDKYQCNCYVCIT